MPACQFKLACLILPLAMVSFEGGIKLLTKLAPIFDRITDIFAGAAGFIVLFQIASICLEIFMRYFLNRPLSWVVEIGETSMLYLTFLGAAWVLRREGHVRVDIVISRVSPEIRVLLNVMNSVIGAAVCLVLVWYGAHETWDNFIRGLYLPDTQMPVAPILAVIPVGSFLLFIQFLRRINKYLSEWRKPAQPEQRVQVAR